MYYTEAIQKETALIEAVGLNSAHMIWSLGVYLEEPDLINLAAQSLTDGGNDKKIDFFRIDYDSRRVIIAQGHYSAKNSDQAPANKASDLNTAAAWLTCGNSELVPQNLRKYFTECRHAIENNEIDIIELLYVHNFPESKIVSVELATAAAYLTSALGRDDITVTGRELGFETTQRLFLVQEASIRIEDTVFCPTRAIFSEKGPGWEAYILSIPGNWLRSIFTKYGEDLFSANYRGFLGLGKRKKINTTIKDSAENKPDNFWVYNNGITILTLGVTLKKTDTELTGISIINGAQTTGSIGHTDPAKHDLSQVKVLCRIVKCDNPEIIGDIVKYNNTQNEITNWDQYSNNSEQQRIAKQFNELGRDYSLKRGFAAAGSELGIEKVVQPVLAFSGNFLAANRGKNQIFERISLYKHAFENRSAKSILFAYSLSKSLDNVRLALKDKESNSKITSIEEKQLRLFQNLRFKYYLIAIIGKNLSIITGKNTDPNKASFTLEISKMDLQEIVKHWDKIVRAVLALLVAFNDIMSDNFDYNSEEAFIKISDQIGSQIEVMKISAPSLFDTFSEYVWENY